MLFEIDGSPPDKMEHLPEYLRPPLDSSVSLSSLPPALKELSVCSSSTSPGDGDDDNDDLSSVSSVSLEDLSCCSQSPASIKRTLFYSYWKSKGGKPKEPLRGSNSFEDLKDTKSSSSSQGVHCYEQLLQKDGRRGLLQDDSNASQGSVRRRLWDNHYVAQSAPSLPLCVEQLAKSELGFRETQSSYGVGGEQQQQRRRSSTSSCLKACRYSGSSRASRRSSKVTVVSFNDDVKVKYVEKPKEVFAEPGWSKHFF